MGIRGLTSYISQNADRFHQFYQLHDCTLVIDGCSLACQLYIRVSGCNSAYGGDYDKFATTIANFFSLLDKCSVTPVVIIDGGYETRKLKTIWKRMKTKLHNAKACSPVNQLRSSVFPLFMMEVFKQVLNGMGVKFAQADFEADFEIAAIARHLNCPVLSYDSDFYVFDVKYIPFSTVSLIPCKIRRNGSVHYYVSCQLYVVDFFISNFGGLDKSLLPLMATLLGNDYVPAYIFSKFFNHVKLPKSKKMTQQQRRIAAIFEWLRKESLQSAVNKILNHLRKGDRDYVKKQIVQSVASYSDCSSELISYLGLNDHNEDQSGSLVAQILIQEGDYESENEFPEKLGNSGEESDSDSSSDVSSGCDLVETKSESHLPNSSKFPPWLKDKFRRGVLPSCLSDIYHLHTYFCQPQVEDLTLNDSHALSFPILKVICGFLLGDVQKRNAQSAEASECSLTCYTRGVGVKPQKIELKSGACLPCLSPLPPLADIPNLLISVRRSILYSSLGITGYEDTKVLESFGCKWELFALAVVFWARNAASPAVTNCHLHAIIMCMITLGVVDEKLGQIRTKKGILKRKAEKLLNSDNETPDGNFKSQKDDTQNYCKETETMSGVPNDHNCNMNDLLRKVSETDCLDVIESLLQFHQMDGKLSGSLRQFCVSTVHIFAQLQACLLQALSLNSILDLPVPPCLISETYSGTVAYMAFSNFNRRSDVEAYITTLMCNAPSVYVVYKALLTRFQILLPNVPVLCRKGKRKSKRKHRKMSNNNTDVEDTDSLDASEEAIDVNNKFSILSVL